MDWNRRRHLAVGLICLLHTGIVASASAQGKPTQATGPKEQALSPLAQQRSDRGKMAPYRALALLAYEAFARDDLMTAARQADTLETVWNQYEEPTLEKTAPVKFHRVDDAMDEFIQPLIAFQQRQPDGAAVRAAYDEYVQKLQLLD